MATQPRAPLEGDPSIKARKQQLFESDEPAAPTGSSKPFAEFLRETPADPIPGWLKAVLWAAGAVVALMLVLALMRVGRPKTPKSSPRAELDPPAAARPLG